MSYRIAPCHSKLDHTLRIAMIGPSPYPEGGTTIPFKILLDRMRACGVVVYVVPIPRGGKNILTKPLKFLGVLAKTIRCVPHVDVISVHVPTPQLSNVAFAALTVARLFQRVFVLRQFTGMDPIELYRHKRLLAKHVIERSSVLFVEARKQRDIIRKWFSREAFWYPNYRLMPPRRPEQHQRNGRFVYLGRVRYDKGIGEIMEAAALPGKRCSVDIYGPCEERFDQTRLSQSAHVHYRGVADNRNVPSILSEYSALLLPTYWEGEGYPGIVIEAFQAGLPVIATRWKYLPELVDETCGILVEPKDPENLRRAMDRLASDTELAQRLRIGALAKGEEFSAERWVNLFVRACCIACENSGNEAETRRRIRGLYTHDGR